MRFKILILFFLAFPSFSFAAVNDVTAYGPSLSATPGGYDVVYGGTAAPSGRSFANQPDGSVAVSDLLSLTTAAGPLALTVTRTIPWQSVVNGAVAGARACLGNPLCVGSAAVVAGLAAYRCELQAWKWMCDDGQPETMQSVACWKAADSLPCALTPSAAAAAAQSTWPLDCYPESGQGQPIRAGYVLTSQTQNVAMFKRTCYSWTGSEFAVYLQGTTTGAACPDYVDPVSFEVKQGIKGLDGLCPTGISRETADAIVASRVAASSASSSDDLRPVFQGAVPGILQTGNGTFSVADPFVITPAWRYATGQSTSSTTTDSAGNVRTETRTPAVSVTNTTTGVNLSNSTTTTTTINGNVTETKTETAPPETVNPPGNPGLTDIPTLYSRKFPDGFAGVWAAREAQFQQTPIISWLNGLVPSFGSGGCPSWTFSPGSVLGITVAGDFSVPCYVWSAVRLFFVISALAVCRRLIFGG